MLNLFNEFKGSLSQMTSIFDDVKSNIITDEEWDAAGLVKTPKEDGTETWNWNDKDTEKEISLSDDGAKYLTDTITAKSNAETLTLADKNLITLNQKLTA